MRAPSVDGSVVREETRINARTIRFVYRAGRASTGAHASSSIIDRIEFSDLVGRLELSPEEGGKLDSAEFWFANGFHSWSPGWELGTRERHPRVRVLKILERYSLRDGQKIARRELAAHGFCYLRGTDTFLVLASRNRGTPPVTFRVERRRRSVEIELHTDGGCFAEGEMLAEVVCFVRTGWFEFSDEVRALFDGLSSLGRAESLRIPRDRPMLVGGWESWYNHYTNIDEALILADLEGLTNRPNLIREWFSKAGRPVVFQIDDGWERAIGDWEASADRFPAGMKSLAEKIEGEGYIPGLWISPFIVSPSARLYRERPDLLLRNVRGKLVRAGWNPGWEGDFYCLDLSIPESRDLIAENIRKIIDEWGYRYLKLDFLYAGMLNGRHSAGGAPYRWYHEALAPVVQIQTNQNGKPVYFLGCGAPIESSVSLFPLMRIGADTKEEWDPLDTRLVGHIGRPSAYINLKDTIGRAFMNRSLYWSDSDVLFLRSKNCKLSESEKELIAVVDLMFSSQLMISDDLAEPADEAEEKLTTRILELYRLLEGREWGAIMLGTDLWRCFSRDGEFAGIINLRAQRARIGAAETARIGLSGVPVTERSRPADGGLLIDRHSLALWRHAQ